MLFRAWLFLSFINYLIIQNLRHRPLEIPSAISVLIDYYFNLKYSIPKWSYSFNYSIDESLMATMPHLHNQIINFKKKIEKL